MALRTLQKAMAQLTLRHPFIASIALGLDLVEDTTQTTGWTDGTRLGFNPEWVQALRAEQVLFFLAHEVYHVVFAHHLRRNGRDPERWNHAADHVVNLLLIENGFEPFGAVLADARFTGMATEQVYEQLQLEEGYQAMGPGEALDFGEVRDARGSNGQDLTGAERQELEAELRVRVTQLSQQEAALQQFGTVAGRSSKVASQALRTSVDWRAALSDFVATVRTRDDYTWKRPNPRYILQGLYLPSLQTETLSELVVAFDTSGSVYKTPQLVSHFASELEALLALYPSSGFHLICCDTKIQSERYITLADSPLRLEVRGGGGTELRPPFEWVDEQGFEPTGLIYFTDLYGRVPDKAPDFPVLWLSYGPLQKAPFGKVVRVPSIS